MSSIVGRTSWGAKGRDGFGTRTLPVSHVFLHHTAGAAPSASATLAQDIAAIRAVESIGITRFGSMSYNFLIAPSGRIFRGVSEHRIGAHTLNYNTSGLGICLVGNYETSKPTAKQRASLIWLLRDLRRRKVITAGARLRGHRDLAATACPGKNAYALIAGIEKESRVVETPPKPAPVKPPVMGIYAVHGPRETLALIASKAVAAGHPAWVTSAGRFFAVSSSHSNALRHILDREAPVSAVFPGTTTHAVLAVYADFPWSVRNVSGVAQEKRLAFARVETGTKLTGHKTYTDALAALLERGIDTAAVFGKAAN